jgi:hypothetical protein
MCEAMEIFGVLWRISMSEPFFFKGALAMNSHTFSLCGYGSLVPAHIQQNFKSVPIGLLDMDPSHGGWHAAKAVRPMPLNQIGYDQRDIFSRGYKSGELRHV